MDSTFFKLYKVPLIFGILGVFLLILSYLSTKGNTAASDVDIYPIHSDIANEAGYIVDVQGAVEYPGIYEFEESMRVADVIALAGGFSPQADYDWIARNLNQAMVVEDGAKYYIPFSPMTLSKEGGETPYDLDQGTIDINTADQEQLETLPGIGEKRAQDIIANRPYGSIEELKTRQVISETIFSEIKELISTY